MPLRTPPPTAAPADGSAGTAAHRGPRALPQVFSIFLRLGLGSFGGPVAHLGYFRTEFVSRRGWLSEAAYADLVALCQMLPGPASSQVGMAIGLQRAGAWGALAAWLGFTLPSALLLMGFAFGITELPRLAQGGAVHGLQLAAVAVVAQAVWGMGRSLCRGAVRMGLAALATLLSLALPSPLTQLAVILLCGLAGAALLRSERGPASSVQEQQSPAETGAPVGRRAAFAALALHLLLFGALTLLATQTGSALWHLASGFYRAGALVFGGGHLVLPLLQATVVPGGAVSEADFLAGYGAAQAVPGPLFSFAAYLGAMIPSGWPRACNALLFLVLLFLPGYLVLVAALPFWHALRVRRSFRAALAGVNAGVVGILLAAWCTPVFTSAVHRPLDLLLAAAGFVLLALRRVPPVAVVALMAAAGSMAG